MIESLLPRLLDGSANINIPACLIQYHYSLLLIIYLLSETHSPLYNQPLLLSSASNLHTLAKMFLILYSPIVHSPSHHFISQSQFSVQHYILPLSIANIFHSLLHFTSMYLSLLP